MRLTLDQYKDLRKRGAKSVYAERADAEDRLQTLCVAWWRSDRRTRHLQLIHIPNQGKRSPMAAARFKRMGMVAGTADLLAVWPNGKIAWIEMKDQKGKQSDAQLDFEEWCTALGLSYHVVRSFAEFEAIALNGIAENKA